MDSIPNRRATQVLGKTKFSEKCSIRFIYYPSLVLMRNIEGEPRQNLGETHINKTDKARLDAQKNFFVRRVVCGRNY